MSSPMIEYGARSTLSVLERPVCIYLNRQALIESQGSPYDLDDLAVGFLLSEQRLSSPDELEGIEVDLDSFSVVISTKTAQAASGAASSASYGAPSTGQARQTRGSSGAFMGSSTLGASWKECPPLPFDEALRFNPNDLLLQMDDLNLNSPHRNADECVHGCGVGEVDCTTLSFVREDIGRHNALDKVIGRAWLNRLDLSQRALFITGRISAEMVMKAYRASCPVLVSRKSATDDAVRRAEGLGITLVSHCRNNYLRILTHPQRIAAPCSEN